MYTFHLSWHVFFNLKYSILQTRSTQETFAVLFYINSVHEFGIWIFLLVVEFIVFVIIINFYWLELCLSFLLC